MRSDDEKTTFEAIASLAADKVDLRHTGNGRAEAPFDLSDSIGTTEQLAEKGDILGEIGAKYTAGHKGGVDSIVFTPGINPRPTSSQNFSASCEVMPYYKIILTFP